MGRLQGTPGITAEGIRLYKANGYCAVVYPIGYCSDSAWFGINDSESCVELGNPPFNKRWTFKKARRKALKHLFKLPKLN